MPELSPKQLAVWLAIAAVILFVGARALRGERATSIEAGPVQVAASAGGDSAGQGLRLGNAGSSDSQAAGAGRQRIFVHVAGAVRRPGLYSLVPKSRIADALRRAGGAVDEADLDRINLAAPVRDGEQILVPRRGESLAGADGQPATDASSAQTGLEAAPISLATASAVELETIDGIGPVTATKILEFRDSEGSIDSVEQLDAIPGIGPATMQTLRQALAP